jgi:hypothetical protein
MGSVALWLLLIIIKKKKKIKREGNKNSSPNPTFKVGRRVGGGRGVELSDLE